VLGIELMNAVQALEFRRPAHSSQHLEHIVSEYRKQVPFIFTDCYMHPYMVASKEFIRREDLY
jgi:histidine ammonia-lyase